VLEGARVQVFFGACGRQSSVTMLEGAGVLHRPFLRSFRGVGIFSVARHVSAQQLGLWLCSLRELPFSMQKKPSSCATAFMASSSKKRPGRVIGIISRMKKSDLVEVARKELGMSLAEANAKTGVSLKEKIRMHRRLNGLPVIPDATREQMKMQIQEDADARWTSTVDEHGFKKTATTIAEARCTSTVDEDYEMIPDAPAPGLRARRARCVGKTRKFHWMSKEQMVFHLGAIKTKAYIDSGELEWHPNPFTGLDTEWMREYLVEIDTVGERESDV